MRVSFSIMMQSTTKFSLLPCEVRLSIYARYFQHMAIRYFPKASSADLRTYKKANPRARWRFKNDGRQGNQHVSLLFVSRTISEEAIEAMLNSCTINVVGNLDMYELTFNCLAISQKQIRRISLIEVDAPGELAVRFFGALRNISSITISLQAYGMLRPIEDVTAAYSISPTNNPGAATIVQVCLTERWPYRALGSSDEPRVMYGWIGDVMTGSMFENRKKPCVELDVLVGFNNRLPDRRGNAIATKSYWLNGRMRLDDWVLRLQKDQKQYAFEQTRFELKNEKRAGGGTEDYMTKLQDNPIWRPQPGNDHVYETTLHKDLLALENRLYLSWSTRRLPWTSGRMS